MFAACGFGVLFMLFWGISNCFSASTESITGLYRKTRAPLWILPGIPSPRQTLNVKISETARRDVSQVASWNSSVLDLLKLMRNLGKIGVACRFVVTLKVEQCGNRLHRAECKRHRESASSPDSFNEGKVWNHLI